ncbi:hypothetical protein [Amycolatopsis arida]|uniref:hypothetical protein n=1 Tax=Amycolatopsis arida TaxID=587909 RepID=UPI000B814F7C|nr:hypothetical protein [Amycolatopsis arida]
MFRGVVTLHTALLVVQPVIVGRFLSGEFTMLAAHRTTASFIMVAALLQILASIALWRPGRRAKWPMAAAVAMLAIEVTQMVGGYSRALGLHLPLGVALVAGGIGFAIWAWLPHPEPTPRKADRGKMSVAGAR